ncbi:MAG: MBL fold metallo-hydrolase [bacterium]|nr:MBL fold metallo-hydrolase [bacterium]
MSSEDGPMNPEALGIHVLSDRIGESIVVTLPGGKWFVVDAFKGNKPGTGRRAHTHTVHSFLEYFRLEPKDCLFVLLTHLHEDHYNGVPSLVRRLRESHEAVVFKSHSAYQPGAFMQAAEKALDWRQRKNPIFTLGTGDRAWEVIELCREDDSDVQFGNILYEGPSSECHVLAVMPDKKIVGRYLSKTSVEVLARVANLDVSNTKKTGFLRASRAGAKIINNMSIGLCVVFGDACVLLTGDSEVEAWRAYWKKPIVLNGVRHLGDLRERVKFVKSPHHGSSLVGVSVLNKLYSRDECRHAASTHHCRTSYELPDIEGIANILKSDVLLAVPNRSFLPGETPLKYFRGTPSITRISVPRGIPGDARRAEELGHTYREPVRPESANEVHWISASFADDGSLGGWFGGSQAGLLRG